jgi:hypothetical protein
MTTQALSKIFIIGGTGAQGLPIVRSLVADKKYSVRVLTRDTTSQRARDLAALGPSVELFPGTFTSEDDLRNGYRGCDAAFINIDGFNTGEKGEMYWAIRAYELAIADGGVKFFVYGNLDYVSKKAGYRPEFRAGHYDGKGRIGEWILFQGDEDKKRRGKDAMGVALFTTGPYIEMVISARTLMTPSIEEVDGVETVTWRVPLTEEGAVAHVALEDCGPYVRWLLDNTERANGMDLEVSIDHIGYHDLAKAFTKVTGRPARFIDVDFETHFREGPLAPRADHPSAYNSDSNDPATLTVKSNFTAFWQIWRHSGGNNGIIQRDYALLDKIHPTRIQSAEHWFRVEEERGIKAGLGSLWERVQSQNLKPILKLAEDGFKAPLASNL